MGDIGSAVLGPVGGLVSAAAGGLGGLTNGVYNGLGLNNNFAGAGAQIQQPITSDQVVSANQQANSALQQQANFVNALQGQAAQGAGSQSALSGMLMNQANGVGPNPAQAMLSQQTANNVAQQAALAAGQRGAGSNVGLIARQAGMQGGNLQQQAVGQGAVLQAQQQLAAQQQLQQLANSQIQQQGGAQNQYAGATQGFQGNMISGINQQNQNVVGMQQNLNNVNAATAQGNQTAHGNFIGNVMGGVGAVAGLAQGGSVKGYAEGGLTVGDLNSPSRPSSSAGQFLSGIMDPGSIKNGTQDTSGEGWGAFGDAMRNRPKSAPSLGAPVQMAGGPMDNMGGMPMEQAPFSYASKGGKVPVMLSPGEKYLSPEQAQAVAQNGKDPIKAGATVPGKAKVKGDSKKNDTVPAQLEEGGIVIPRSIVESKDAAKKAAKFVEAHLAQRGSLPKKS